MKMLSFLLAGLVVVLPLHGRAQTNIWPAKPVRLVVPFAAGGGVDTVARPFAQRLAEVLGQPVIVDNKPGGGTAIGTDNVLKSGADGYTVLFTTNSFVTGPLLSKSPQDPLQRLRPLGLVCTAPFVVVTGSSGGISDLPSLKRLAAGPNESLTFASAGIGSLSHLAGEVFVSALGVSGRHVPYRGLSPAVADLVEGRINIAFDGPAAALPLIQGGQLRAIAVTGNQRLPALPRVPTLGEAGLPAMDRITYWVGLFVSRDTPELIVAKLSASLDEVLRKSEFVAILGSQGLSVATLRGDALAGAIAAESAQWSAVIRDRGIVIEGRP